MVRESKQWRAFSNEDGKNHHKNGLYNEIIFTRTRDWLERLGKNWYFQCCCLFLFSFKVLCHLSDWCNLVFVPLSLQGWTNVKCVDNLTDLFISLAKFSVA